MRKVQSVKRDKKLVRNMLAIGLPGKLQYPLFSAIAGLCFTMAIDETEEENNVALVALPSAAPTTTVAAVTVATPTYTGKGAYMGASFVDLEANMHNSNSSSGSSSGERRNKWKKRNKRRKENKQHNLADPAVDPMTPIVVVNTGTEEKTVTVLINDSVEGNKSDLSDADGISDESADESDRQSTDAVLSEESVYRSRSSEHSYGTAQSSATPSDFSEVVYSLSSESDV